MSLPYPSIVFTPLTTITAQDHNNQMANVTSLAAGTGISDGVITASKINFASGISGKILGETTLASAAASISVSLPSTATNLRITISIPSQTGNATLAMRFNGDGTNSYAYRATNNGSVEGTSTAAFSLQLTEASVNPHNTLSIIDVINFTTRTKGVQVRTLQGAANASATPTRRFVDGVWANTTSQINSLTVYDSTSTSQFAAGSKVTVTAA